MNKKIITTLAILFFNLSAINVAYAAETGELNFGSKAKYIGEVKNGKAHGIGALKTVDGTNYIGVFKRNIVNGAGILIKLHADVALADLRINDDFPQLNKNEIQGALTNFRGSWVRLQEVEDQLTSVNEGSLELKVERHNLKKKFFESTYPEWWTNASKKANNDEKLLLDGIQIFVGKWKYGTHNEYFDKGKNFRRQTKLKKLDEIAKIDGGIIAAFEEPKKEKPVIGAQNTENIDENKNKKDERKGVFVFDTQQGDFVVVGTNISKPVIGAQNTENIDESKNKDERKGVFVFDPQQDEFAKTWIDGSTFSGTLDNRGLMSTGTYFDAVSGKTYEYENGQNITVQAGSEAKKVNSILINSVNLEIKNKNGKYYKANLVSTGQAKPISSISKTDLRIAVNTIVNDRKRRGKKGEKKLRQQAKKIKKELRKTKSSKKREKLEEKLNKVMEKLGRPDQTSASAISIEISEDGQNALDADTAAADSGGSSDTGGGGGGGEGGGGGGS